MENCERQYLFFPPTSIRDVAARECMMDRREVAYAEEEHGFC
jgi:hypothetical protein